MAELKDFENKIASNGVHYSRIIASWMKEASSFGMKRYIYEDQFQRWLGSLGLTETEQYEIYYLATNGKMELESNAYKFLQENCKDEAKMKDQFLHKS